MALYSVRSADHQHRIVQHLQRAFHLRRKIHMSRCVQQRDILVLPLKLRLLGKNCDSPVPLLTIRIQKRVPVIHPSQPADRTA